MYRNFLPACLVLLCASAACSVKEDRGPCPCYLKVTFADPDASGPVQLAGWDTETVFREKVRIEDCRPAWIRPVRKGTFVLSACKGAGNAVPDGREVRIPVNCEADSLYAFSREVDATGDVATVEVTLKKQFATVFLDLRKTPETMQGFRFQVDGNTCGFNLLDFSPVRGPFRCDPRPAEGGSVVTFRVPRQTDDSLEITVRPADAPPARFPLGEYISRSGYSWKTEELQDIYIVIDLARGRLDLRVEDWEEGIEFPLIEI